eukprot:363351-Chlamydomonas_euryale.AAC.5
MERAHQEPWKGHSRAGRLAVGYGGQCGGIVVTRHRGRSQHRGKQRKPNRVENTRLRFVPVHSVHSSEHSCLACADG